MKEEIKLKNVKIEDSENNILNIVKIMDKQKKLLSNLKGSLAKKEKEIAENKLNLLEKEQEIIYLRSYLNSFKLDNGKKNKIKFFSQSDI